MRFLQRKSEAPEVYKEIICEMRSLKVVWKTVFFMNRGNETWILTDGVDEYV